MDKLLEAIRKRPAMYLGNTKHLFVSLDAFLGGYEAGFAAAKFGNSTPQDLVPSDFHKFVTERFGRQFPDGGKGWKQFVEENASSDEDAFTLFFKLREEYDERIKSRPALQQTAVLTK